MLYSHTHAWHKTSATKAYLASADSGLNPTEYSYQWKSGGLEKTQYIYQE